MLYLLLKYTRILLTVFECIISMNSHKNIIKLILYEKKKKIEIHLFLSTSDFGCLNLEYFLNSMHENQLQG